MTYSCPKDSPQGVIHRCSQFTGFTGRAWQDTGRLTHKRAQRRGQTKCAISERAGFVVSLQEWSANPLFERKDNKKEALLDLDGRVANLNKRYAAVKDAGVRIQAMVTVRKPLGGLLEAACFLWRKRGVAKHFDG